MWAKCVLSLMLCWSERSTIGANFVLLVVLYDFADSEYQYLGRRYCCHYSWIPRKRRLVQEKEYFFFKSLLNYGIKLIFSFFYS